MRERSINVQKQGRGMKIDVTTTSLTFLFGITTFVADESLRETLGLEAADVEVILIILIDGR